MDDRASDQSLADFLTLGALLSLAHTQKNPTSPDFRARVDTDMADHTATGLGRLV